MAEPGKEQKKSDTKKFISPFNPVASSTSNPIPPFNPVAPPTSNPIPPFAPKIPTAPSSRITPLPVPPSSRMTPLPTLANRVSPPLPPPPSSHSFNLNVSNNPFSASQPIEKVEENLSFKTIRAKLQQNSQPFSYKRLEISIPAVQDSRSTEKYSAEQMHDFLQKQSVNAVPDDRPTENISQDELQKHLELERELKKAEQNKSLMPNPSETDARPTEAISVAELQEYLEEQQRQKLSESTITKAPWKKEIPSNSKIYDFYLASTPLGQGAGAYVFKIFHDEEHQYPAGIVKLAKEGLQSQLYKELEFAKQYLNREIYHENIIGYYQTGVSPLGLPFIICEELYPFPFPRKTLEDAVCILSRMADLVAYLHKMRLYHRDIKPENILYSSYSGLEIVPKLLDFGTLSKQIQEKENAACSPYYAAPEVLRKISGISLEDVQFSRADVFSLGMTFFGLLNFNPYLVLQPDLEKKYNNPRQLVEALVQIHQEQSPALFQVMDQFLQSYFWNPSLVLAYGIKSTQHRELLDGLSSILFKAISPNPEERPLSSNLAKQIEGHFIASFACSTQKYLSQGGSLFPEGPKLL